MSFKEILENNDLVLIDFFATWCGPCKTLAPILKQVKDDVGEIVKIFKIDVDKHTELARIYDVQSIPVLLLFKENKLVWRSSGIKSKQELVQIINSYSSNH